MTTGVIFDMDGVLIDSESFYFERRMNFFTHLAVTPTSVKMADYVGKTEKGIWETLVPNNSNLRKQLYFAYLDYRQAHPIDFQQVLRKEVRCLLRELKKQQIKLALASSSPLVEINKMLRQCQIQHYFDFVISGEELEKSKPHPEIYLKCKQALAVTSFLAVEDSTVGIEAAKAANIYTVALKQPFYVDQTKADRQINHLNEVMEVISEQQFS
ncbi:HAD family hydrolase [Enterococcus ratti]|uniref:Haloacid dehalogenase n=1 Tax=Enterococcus ratti TaxID=150033 RepID=A0A1L8WQ91_9ENTE|nr:HAD family phosphatase [Enterococcus ratti]OJG83173.1 haloacid dehalogenase [Enterococcus ratti]